MTAIARRFVEVDGRAVHYRVAGRGPVALLIHQSPRSSAEYEALMSILAEDFTVIASDNPGNGLSDPLPEGARSIEDYGDALARLLTALGVGRVLVYGFHTGGAIGLAFSSRHPDRVAASVLNGIPVPDLRGLDAFVERYLVPFEPRWDGSHLVWLWARLREQTIFYSWFSNDDADRVMFTPPDGDALFHSCLDFLRAGDAYRHAYEAAFRIPTQSLIDALSCPAVIVSARWDPLYDEMDPLVIPDGVDRVRLGMGPAESIPLIKSAFAEHAGRADARLKPARDSNRGFAAGIHYSRRDGAGRPLVLLHDHHDDLSSEGVAAIVRTSERPTVALDLPGHGETPEPWEGLADAGIAVAGALDGLGIDGADVVGLGLGAIVARHLCASGRLRFDERSKLPSLRNEDFRRGAQLIAGFAAPVEHAGRLLGAWRMARDGALFDPWCAPRPASARRPAGDLEPVAIHRRAVAALKSMGSWQASWADMHGGTS